MTKRIRVTLASFLLFAVLLPSCANSASRPEAEWEGRTLCGVAYVTKNGMTWGDDFELRLTEDRIAYVRYFSRLLRRYREKEDRPLSPGKWAEIGEAVLAALPELREIRPAPPEYGEEEEIFATDMPTGPTGLWLTWRAADGTEEEVRYGLSGGDAADALFAILQKTGH